MANYIGNIPSQGEFKKLDSIASSFDGNETQFNLNYNSVSQPVGDASQLIVSLNGVIQEPLTAYTLGIGGSTIVFSSAPQSGDTCHIVLIGGVGGTATPSDNSVTAEKIASTDDFTFGSITVTGSGSIDGRDISADGTKLDGIEENADVTDTANVTAAGALMDSELTDEAAVKALDQGVATTDAVTFAGVSTDEFDLSAIDASIADTAVDIFIYDTSKDSDGGAWRKRTQHTSWYTETLNTSTRGSRREFPAVAVLVLESNELTIYDGDDPDLPMWMVFSLSSGTLIRAPFPTAVFMINAKLAVTSDTNYAGSVVDFLIDGKDNERDFRQSVNYNNIAGRNGGHVGNNSPLIVNQYANDVAMTVLPNAPIDSATGLPVPTIAVATDGGVSVIKDDGTVVSSSGDGASKVEYLDNNYLVITRSGSGGYIAVHNSHFTSGSWNGSSYAYFGSTIPPFNVNGTINGIAASENGYFGNSIGVHVYEDLSSNATNADGLFSNITSTYNTGWMNGDIKLATLSDTDDTDVTGSELLTNGTLDSATGWSFSGSGEYTITGGQLVDGDSLGQFFYSPYATVEVGKTYTATFEADGSGGTPTISIADTSGNVINNVVVTNGAGLKYYSITFTPTSGQTSVRFEGSGNSWTGYYDNFSIRLAEEDRSVNDKGLQVFGTVTKNPVATGADLVAYSYSTTSSGNKLIKPYDSNLAFGTNDFCFMFWTKADDYTPNGSGVSFVRTLNTDAVSGKGGISIASSTADDLRFQLFVDGNVSPGRVDCIDFTALPTGVWNHIVALRTGTTLRLYLNGILVASNGSGGVDVSNLNTDPIEVLSFNQAGVEMALLRISATAPSAEQIKKIYEDEKFLFQENAQATLYGSSDAVTALAYDDETELLHVGTSAGRSVFQGLRRVENTTDAVSTAISANNGMVAEQ